MVGVPSSLRLTLAPKAQGEKCVVTLARSWFMVIYPNSYILDLFFFFMFKSSL
jgi:hypothetical protein